MELKTTNRQNRHGFHLRYFAPLICLLCFCSVLSAQELSVGLHFSFRTKAVQPLFDQIAENVVENELSSKLAAVCKSSQSLRYWTFDSKVTGTPRLEISVMEHRGIYYLHLDLKHQPDSHGIPDRWDIDLFLQEDIVARGLPRNKKWISPIETALENILDLNSRKGREIFSALQYFVPLGKDAVMLPPKLSSLPAAVLSLKWDNSKEISRCGFRLEYADTNPQISLHSRGAGRPMDYTPDDPKYKAIWVLHDTFQLGGLDPRPIGQLDLDVLRSSSSSTVIFFLEPGLCTLATISK